jgi:hypothetical protein
MRQGHNILEQCWVLLPFYKSKATNKENTHSLVTQIEFKSFLSIVGRYLLVFVDVALEGSSPLFKNDMDIHSYEFHSLDYGSSVFLLHSTTFL